MTVPTFSVSEVNRYIKTMFDSELMFQSIFVSGEISNFSNHYKTGHLYFTLKDEAASIKAVMFNRAAARLNFAPENGMRVTLLGRISVFERDGVYQIYVEHMQPDGAGALAAAFEQLKKKLAAEGLFDTAHKKALPEFPKRIGVISSPTGAAVQDILSILARRYPLADLVFQPVSVQGASSALELTQAINQFSRKKCADVIIIGRGGGNAEDLWCFNDEQLARAIYACTVPVISAVGHETDFTICDFVSDMRAPTPSAAAEIAVPDINNLLLETASLTDRLFLSVNKYVSQERKKLEQLLESRSFTKPGNFFDKEHLQLQVLLNRLKTASAKRLNSEKLLFSEFSSALERLNPMSVLQRGYSIVNSGGAIQVSVKDIKAGQELDLAMADGNILCKVVDVKKSENSDK